MLRIFFPEGLNSWPSLLDFLIVLSSYSKIQFEAFFIVTKLGKSEEESVGPQFFKGAVFFLLFPKYASVSGLLQLAAFRGLLRSGGSTVKISLIINIFTFCFRLPFISRLSKQMKIKLLLIVVKSLDNHSSFLLGRSSN